MRDRGAVEAQALLWLPEVAPVDVLALLELDVHVVVRMTASGMPCPSVIRWCSAAAPFLTA
jgi:hypothetical protein